MQVSRISIKIMTEKNMTHKKTETMYYSEWM